MGSALDSHIEAKHTDEYDGWKAKQEQAERKKRLTLLILEADGEGNYFLRGSTAHIQTMKDVLDQKRVAKFELRD